MYGGKQIAAGDTIFVFSSENEGGQGLVARGIVVSAEATPRRRGVARQTPRVSVTIKHIAFAKRPLGRSVLKPFDDWDDGNPRPNSILNSIVRRRTRSWASRIKPRRFSADFSEAADHTCVLAGPSRYPNRMVRCRPTRVFTCC